jgi:hypothetical protein
MDASKQVQRGVIQFLRKEGASPSDILRRMKDVNAYLRYRKACAQWVPKHLTDEQINLR